MPLKNRSVSRRAWNLLRLSILWARKGGVFRRRLATELRLVPKYLKRFGHTTTTPSQIHYFERELSFDKTPIFNVKMYRPSSMRFHLPHIPCINPHVDFDYDFNDDYDENNNNNNMVEYDNGRKSLVLDSGEFHHGCEGCQEILGGSCEEEEEREGDGEEIDMRAEEFIAKFYKQMRLQRQISLLQYKETPSRDMN